MSIYLLVIFVLLATCSMMCFAAEPVRSDQAVERLDRFILETMQTLLEKQTAHLGGDPQQARFITVTRPAFRAWTSLGPWDGRQYSLLPIPAKAVEERPTTCDFPIWPVLERLGQRSDGQPWRRMLQEQIEGFVQHGFDPASGLLHTGAMSRFDVVQRGPVGVSVWDEPCFKPGGEPELRYLWEAAPQPMARFCRSAYYGLVTRPATMDFNRYVKLGWDDSAEKPAQAFNAWHRGFILTGAKLMLYWSTHHARNGDPQTLEWTRRLADKFAAVQHEKTGLLPHFFGAVEEKDPNQSPTPYAQINDAQTAVCLLEAAAALRDAQAARTDAARQAAADPQRRKLADDLHTMGLRLLLGLAREGYDSKRRLFHDWIDLRGGPWLEQGYYTFRTQAVKDEALKRDPRVSVVDVFEGYGFFTTRPHDLTAGSSILNSIVEGAVMTQDAELIALARRLTRDALEQANQINSPFNEQRQFVFPAMGVLIRACVGLHQLTGERDWLARAAALAQRQIEQLEQDPKLDGQSWWAMPARSGFLLALLELSAALAEKPR